MPVKTKSVPKGVKAPLPLRIEPMLCSLIEKPFNNEEWWYEVKWDGYRVTAHIQKKKVALRTRKGLDYSKRYPPVAKSLSKLKHDAVLDGEVVVLNDEGKHDFHLLQNYNGTGGGTLAYYVFDILWMDGYDLMHVPLSERRSILNSSVDWDETVRCVDTFDDGIALFEQCQVFGFEGIVCKRKDSIYVPNKRSNDWRKLKHKMIEEYVIIGYVPSESGKSFKTLLVGKYDDDKLKYIHHSGGGYTDEDKKILFSRLKKIVTKKSLVVNESDVELDDPHVWVKPEMVAQFEKSRKLTGSGKIRHPVIFLGLREDKDPEDVVKETPLEKKEETAVVNKGESVDAKNKMGEGKEITGTWKEIESRPITSRNKFEVEGKTTELVNIEKELWHGVTKSDLINYYINIAPYILKYLRDRPLALNINLQGPFSNNFFLRGLQGHYPEWAEVFKTKRKHPKKGKSPYIEWLVCNDLATLVWMINLECIDMHPWNSRVETFKQADYIVIDLDPTIPDTHNEKERKKFHKEGFLKAIETAHAAKEFFDTQKIKSFIKTSGKTGLHLYLPCEGIEFGDEGGRSGEARLIALNICTQINELVPDITTLSFSQSSRDDKVYVDPNQNDYADRVACAYCVRAAHHPQVSAPLDWREVNDKLSPENFSINNMIERVKKKGDVWAKLLDEKIRKANTKVLRSFL